MRDTSLSRNIYSVDTVTYREYVENTIMLSIYVIKFVEKASLIIFKEM